jgi:hypothetical protein
MRFVRINHFNKSPMRWASDRMGVIVPDEPWMAGADHPGAVTVCFTREESSEYYAFWPDELTELTGAV